MSSAATTHDAYLGRKYFLELDGLRALSVLLVVTAHMYSVGPTWGFLAGYRGVTIFFVLSGYLITTLALREEKTRGAVSLAAFYVRRSCRILPLYYVTLAAYCILVYGLSASAHLRAPLTDALPYYLLYLQEIPFCLWRLVNSYDLVFHHSWTLGAEEKFYLLWPLLAFALWRARPSGRLRGGIALAAAFGLVPFVLTPLGPEAEVAGRMLFCYASLLAGCVLACLLDDPRWFTRLRPLGGSGWISAALLTLLAAHLATPHVGQPWADAVNVLYTLAVTAVLACVLLGEGPVQRLLRIRPLVFVGQLSYGVYLVHMVGLYAASRLVPGARDSVAGNVMTFVVACLLSVALAWVLRLTVELPCIAWGRRWSQRILSRREAPEPARVAPVRPRPRPVRPADTARRRLLDSSPRGRG
jgi:peptidoglycan/LPS O-acetylase OafA/YrhL